MLITKEDIYHTEKILDFIKQNQQILAFRHRRIQKGDLILNQGQSVENIFFITQGQISLSRSAIQGRRYQLGTFTHNGFLGLMELFSDKSCFYTVSAESDCDAYIINGKAFSNLVCNTPKLAAYTFKHLTSKWYLSVERMTRNILHTISYCIIDDLILFSQQCPEEKFIINKSLECERLGTSLRVYNRILKHLSEIGAIKVSRQHIDILDVSLLLAERDIELEK